MESLPFSDLERNGKKSYTYNDQQLEVLTEPDISNGYMIYLDSIYKISDIIESDFESELREYEEEHMVLFKDVNWESKEWRDEYSIDPSDYTSFYIQFGISRDAPTMGEPHVRIFGMKE